MDIKPRVHDTAHGASSNSNSNGNGSANGASRPNQPHQKRSLSSTDGAPLGGGSSGGGGGIQAGQQHSHGDTDASGSKRKRTKRSSGKACVYCRRSHMVCEGGRPCERCVKREIAHLCRDVSPQPQQPGSERQGSEVARRTTSPSLSTHVNSHINNQSQNMPQKLEASISPFDQLNDQNASIQRGDMSRANTQRSQSQSSFSQSQSGGQQTQNRLPTSLYSDPNFPPSWPLLPDSEGPVSFDDGGGSSDLGRLNNFWNTGDDSELGALTKFLGDLGGASMPGGFLDVLSYFSKGGNSAPSQTQTNLGIGNPSTSSLPTNNANPAASYQTTSDSISPQITSNADSVNNSSTNGPGRNETPTGTGNVTSNGVTSNNKGKGKEVSFAAPQLSGISRIERYFLAAADQPSGPRASRLAQVIKAKYDAGLLRPYDYIKGYERMNKWMDSGRAGPKADSNVGSVPNSPKGGIPANSRARPVSSTPVPAYGGSISSESRRRILTALNGFRPKFRQIARTLTDVDLVFVEEAMERWMLEYDRAFASIHTPSCIWRRTGEIQKANQEFANLTGIPASMFRNGILCVYELMDEDSAVRYWEGYAKVAFDAGQRSLYTTCTLKIPTSLAHPRLTRSGNTPGSLGSRATNLNGSIPEFSLPQPLVPPPSYDPASRAGSEVGSTAGQYDRREEYREIKCCFSVTIRRDAWGVPVAIMGQWIVSVRVKRMPPSPQLTQHLSRCDLEK